MLSSASAKPKQRFLKDRTQSEGRSLRVSPLALLAPDHIAPPVYTVVPRLTTKITPGHTPHLRSSPLATRSSQLPALPLHHYPVVHVQRQRGADSRAILRQRQ